MYSMTLSGYPILGTYYIPTVDKYRDPYLSTLLLSPYTPYQATSNNNILTDISIGGIFQHDPSMQTYDARNKPTNGVFGRGYSDSSVIGGKAKVLIHL